MMREMIDAFDRVDADDDVRVVIVTGRGRGFCAGADLGAGGETFDADAAAGTEVRSVPRDGGGLVTLRIFECTKPVIAAMNGSAVGIGVTMTLPMDIRVLSDRGQGRLRVRRPGHRARGVRRAGSCPGWWASTRPSSGA